MTFSIITVTYNAARWIERTMASVLAQTYSHIEYIIVDGGSADGTVDIIRHHQSNIKWSSEPDKGLYDAMNKGLQRATGDYVWFLNAGDTLHSPDTVARLAEQASRCQPLPCIVYGETDIIDDAGSFIAHRRLKSPRRLTWRSFRMGMLVCHQSFVVRRDVALPFDLRYRYSADFDWCIRCMKAAVRIHNAHLILSNYLNEGTTTANRKASLKERFAIMAKYYGWLPSVLRHLWFGMRFYLCLWIYGRKKV
jgi:glycosyltransferase involved in cell wall biosynthesis